ncbi:MAG: DNA alkylation repair protein [Clostridia bacterium]|nr:DNA alkylation repair protein [Clostridia bacterium]
MTTEKIREDLFSLRDEGYRAFQAKLIPTVAPDRIIGVRTPELRRFAKSLLGRGEADAFLSELPHAYFDEDQLHAFLLSERKDFVRCREEVDRFLPYVDNWATCDQLSPRVFYKHRRELLSPIRSWIASGATYPVRFGVGMLMQHFLDGDFKPAYPAAVAAIRSEEYYVRMMVAWYFATALAKQYGAVLPYLKEGRLDPWTHNKAIAKALESRRISPERKAYLRSLKK